MHAIRDADWRGWRRHNTMNAFETRLNYPFARANAPKRHRYQRDNAPAWFYRLTHVGEVGKLGLSQAAGLESVLEANRAAIARFARARLRQDDAVEDVLQDLWLKIRSIETGPIAEPLAYLYRMTDNLILDRRRAESRRSARDHGWSERQSDGSSLGTDARPSPERHILGRDMLNKVNARLKQLPERTVAVFYAVRVDKRPQKDLASELGISVSAIEKHLQRAYREIVTVKEELEQDRFAVQPLIGEGIGHNA